MKVGEVMFLVSVGGPAMSLCMASGTLSVPSGDASDPPMGSNVLSSSYLDRPSAAMWFEAKLTTGLGRVGCKRAGDPRKTGGHGVVG